MVEGAHLRRKSIPPPGYLCKNPTLWRMRAEEMRTLAEEARDSTVRAMMLRLAADYDWRAENVDDRAAQDSIMFRVATDYDSRSGLDSVADEPKRASG
jgi:hypothetical protein